VKDLIAYAYNLPFGTEGFVSGGPKWAYADTYDIELKSEAEVEAKSADHTTVDQVSNQDRFMVQSVLATKFGLRVHHEAKLVQGFALTVTKGGPKLMHSSATATPPVENTPTYAFGATLPTPQAGHATMRLTPGDIHAPQSNMGWLAGYLQFQPEMQGRAVVDKTALTGNFDISLKWLPEAFTAATSTEDSVKLPGLFTALQEQLGLKLEQTKTTADSIFIDELQRPTEN
jgi:uncharacterized protein (TIGR03435 family)